MRTEKIKQFQAALAKLGERVGGEVNQVVASIHADVDAKPNISSAPVHLADIAADAVDANLEILHTERDLLDQIHAALGRIQDGTFGRCIECHKEIADQRLRALPYTAMCVQCARGAAEPAG